MDVVTELRQSGEDAEKFVPNWMGQVETETAYLEAATTRATESGTSAAQFYQAGPGEKETIDLGSSPARGLDLGKGSELRERRRRSHCRHFRGGGEASRRPCANTASFRHAEKIPTAIHQRHGCGRGTRQNHGGPLERDGHRLD